MQNHLTYKISLIMVALLFTINGNAQHNYTVRFENDTIAVKRQNDSIYFYNSLGEIRKIVSLKNKKSTPYGLPKEVQEIIYDGEIPERIEISEETFPTYLYTQRYVDAGIVLCSVNYFYNDLGLQTGYKEICPDDLADGDDNHFGDKDLYKYNKYGLLIEKEGDVYQYNNHGQLIEKCYRNAKSKKISCSRKYKYQNDKLIASTTTSEDDKNTLGYTYNSKGLLSEIVRSKRSKIVLEYNEQDKIIKVSDVKTWRDKTYKNTRLIYHYNLQNRIIKINTYTHYPDFPFEDWDFVYDLNGNLTQKKLNGEVIESYKYDANGTLIYIENNKRWGEDKGHVTY
ncbi:hypothetical protein ABW636_17520 [Aquimarina sp. 2201CG1-2-11]|uniref:hypothetical protein n=1 Tax=Aquimarina discodermiae TaxID=3231043 RepID=UPI003462D047